jgi:hypothetical protein
MIRRARSWIVHRFFGGEDRIAIAEHGKAVSLKEASRRQRAIERQETPKEGALNVPTALDNGQRSPRKLLAGRVDRHVLHRHRAVRVRGDVREEVLVEVVIHQ